MAIVLATTKCTGNGMKQMASPIPNAPVTLRRHKPHRRGSATRVPKRRKNQCPCRERWEGQIRFRSLRGIVICATVAETFDHNCTGAGAAAVPECAPGSRSTVACVVDWQHSCRLKLETRPGTRRMSTTYVDKGGALSAGSCPVRCRVVFYFGLGSLGCGKLCGPAAR
jgi:hypothetical protein